MYAGQRDNGDEDDGSQTTEASAIPGSRGYSDSVENHYFLSRGWMLQASSDLGHFHLTQAL